MYLLGDCYLKTGDKNSARNAFGLCADMDFNHGQREASLLLAGKLAYEMGYNNEASSRLRSLLALYPNSTFRPEAKTLFSELLAKTSNFEEAYRNLQDIGQGGGDYSRVYQKVSYGYAMQQLQAGDQQQAYLLLEKSLQHPADRAYLATTGFWLSELAYRMQQYDAALKYGEVFVNNSESAERIAYLSPSATPQHAYMNMGYAAMKLEQFSVAQAYFAKAQQSAGSMKENAVLREADAAFMSKQFVQAAVLYDKAIATNNSSDADYARLQKSILLGLQNKHAEKIALLQSIISQRAGSPYMNDARYELAVAYIDENKFRPAIEALQPLTTGSDTRKAPAAWLKIGFAHQELDEDEQAIDAYRHVVVDYPSAGERAAALDALKSLYIQHNQPGVYAALLQEHNLPDADGNSLDSTWYAAAEAQYAAGKYTASKAAMTEYLRQYPNGLFTLKAHFYQAESAYQLKEYKEAMTGYEAVLNAPWNDFSELSALKAAGIAAQEDDYIMAYRHYLSLRNNAMNPQNLRIAYGGMTKSSFHQNWFTETVHYADTLLSLPGVTDAELTDARFYKAKSLLKQNAVDTALLLFQQLSFARNGAIAAEAKYSIADIYLKQHKLKEAEDMANQVIKQSGGNDYWVVKSYILLGDLLAQQKDYFNAKAALQSIVKNAKIPELKAEAARKLEEVKELEKKQSKLED
jgi:TolA-binding protein